MVLSITPRTISYKIQFKRKWSAILISKMAAKHLCIIWLLLFSQLLFLHNKNRKICKNGSEMMFFIPAIKGNRLIYGGHFDLTFWRSRTQSIAMVEQKMESAYLKYVNRHDYLLVLKMPLEVIFSQNQTSLLSHIDWFPVIDSRFVILLLSMSNNYFWHVRFVSSASLCHYGPA